MNDDPVTLRQRQGRSAQRRGREFEWRVWRLLERLGWKVVRSSGSHSPADLLAASPFGVRWLIQCKGARRALSRAEREALEEWAVLWDGLAILAQPGPLRTIRWRVRSGDQWTAIDPGKGGYLA